MLALVRKVAEEGTGTERQKETERQAVGRCRQGDAERFPRAHGTKTSANVRSISYLINGKKKKQTCSTNQPHSPPTRNFRSARGLSLSSNSPAIGPGPFCLHDAGGHGARGKWSHSTASAPRKNLENRWRGRGTEGRRTGSEERVRPSRRWLDLLANADALIEGFRPGRDGTSRARA